MSAASHNVGIVEGGLAFGECWGRAMLFAASVDMDSPRHFQRIKSCPIWGGGASVDAVVCTILSGFLEDGAVYRVIGAAIAVFLCLQEFA